MPMKCVFKRIRFSAFLPFSLRGQGEGDDSLLKCGQGPGGGKWDQGTEGGDGNRDELVEPSLWFREDRTRVRRGSILFFRAWPPQLEKGAVNSVPVPVFRW